MRPVTLLLAEGRVVVVVDPVWPLVPTVGRLPPTCGRTEPVLLVRTELFPAPTRPLETLPVVVGRVPAVGLAVLRLTVAPVGCWLLPVGILPLIEPVVPVLPCLTLAT